LPGQMQKSRFAAAAFASQRDKIALIECQRDVLKRGNLLACRSINLPDISQLEPRHLLSG